MAAGKKMTDLSMVFCRSKETHISICVIVYLQSTIRLVNINFVTLKMNFFKICVNSTLYSYFGGTAADFPTRFSFTAI